ncbi:hypothetical protein ACFSB1_00345 [Halopseudomonas phragmitis]|uniref:Uncharacterized protein n=1 Tax=Halopseudomonas phragmitis TaxID=1931241 RepID=A0A1V0B689_9GAMM|nr:hypothetical protein [Halopseudomonas phragmitis]AQZ95435.1 hypothetical protein BVH74_12045 [Halopseudomonas phragmitis]
MSSDQARHRHECEARDWLRRGYTTPDRIDELKKLITSKRGSAAAEALIEEMRRQWRRRAEWMK